MEGGRWKADKVEPCKVEGARRKAPHLVTVRHRDSGTPKVEGKVEGGRWKVEGGRWKMVDSERWTVEKADSRRWKVEGGIVQSRAHQLPRRPVGDERNRPILSKGPPTSARLLGSELVASCFGHLVRA